MTDHMSDAKVLIVEDDHVMADKCRKLFRRAGYKSVVAYSGREALAAVADDPTIQIVLTDLKMPKMDGIELLRRLKQSHPDIDVLIMTGYGAISTAVQAIKMGATDYVTKPFDKDELLNAIERIMEARRLKSQVSVLHHQLDDKFGFRGIIGKSKAMSEVLQLASQAAASDSSVMILGESGTGKELVARAMHHGSSRAQAPFVPINCGALPKDLIESELFGYRKGAYTGANKASPGLFRTAHRGTIFLDELVEMPSDTQVKLLRVLQEKQIRPVGDTREIPVDVRVLSATNQNIHRALESSKLRKDLYYRLSVVVIEIPPLRKRLEDIPLLIRAFLEKYQRDSANSITEIDQEALRILMAYSWPGNVRELENLVESLFVVGVKGQIQARHVRPIIDRRQLADREEGGRPETVCSLNDAERVAIKRALEAAHGNKSKAAAILGISRTRLYKKLDLYDLTF